MDIGSKLRYLRKARHLSSVELAQRANVSQSSISDIECNRRSPRLNTLSSLSRALGIPLSELLPVDDLLEHPLKEEERQLLDLFGRMNESQQQNLLELLQSFSAKS
ncbi:MULTISPECIES: helix-turn-helix domain-containing protein [Saccharibacillus]|uniref:Helix-turn-helix transcriptional regulator n=1 Tax=Saccharibacillus brassicae TaxID=2583377 RepID=A0A4Y6V3I0_SACBS|nr:MULTISPECIES: helix-turn-helix transcriptional regulator [Saccharibacillus]MWJ30340.1 helix-turn-helix domain-containing protein [Saccharibacillus sp. WB 17]QDH23408.1 helix-turn-helix transcriptional regulator [Saccharibacillus brassicae]